MSTLDPKPDRISLKTVKMPIMGKRDLDLYLFKVSNIINNLAKRVL